MHASYTGAQNVVVNVKGLIDSTCKTGPCIFIYDTSTSPTVTDGIAEDDTYAAGEVLSIVGTGLTGMKVEIGGNNLVVTPNTDAATGGTFVFPALYFGKHPVYISVPGKGYAFLPINVNIVMSVD